MRERYPLPMKCPECGKTMRPVHKHRVPDMPRYYFCTFCDAMISEDHPDIRFSEALTNFGWLKSLSPEEFALWLVFRIKFDNCTSFDEWLDWLKSPVEVDDGCTDT